MRSLNVDVARDFFESAEDFKPVGMHLSVPRSETKVLVDLLEPFEAVVEDRDGTVDDGATLKPVNVPGMDALIGFDAFAVLRTCSFAVDTFSVHSSFIRRTTSHAGSVVFQQVLWTVFNACRSVGVLPFRVMLPRVRRRVVRLHRRTFLSAFAVVVEVSTSLWKILGIKSFS